MSLIVACVLFTSLQPNALPADPSQDRLSRGEEEVRKLEREWLDAYEKHDAAAMDRIVGDDFTITFADGTVQTKPQVLASIRPPRSTTQPGPKFWTEEVKSRTYGDTVILIGKVITEERRGDMATRETSRYTDTYVKKDGRWQVVASHLSKLAPPKR
jgi:uncharacterized protein (TIGR02246 family)